jgi:hypothetical protein
VPTVDALMDVYWVQPTGMSTATTVLNNDIGSPLHVSEVNGNYADVGRQITLPSGAMLTLFTNGTFQYTPINTDPDYFTYKTTDGVDSVTATVNIYVVNSTPTQLYATYEAAVEDADADYASAVATEIATRDAAIAAARDAAQDDADDLYDVYLAAFGTAETAYLAAVADAETDYNDDVADAVASWATANDAAMAVYDAAIADAQDEYDVAIAALEATFDQDSDYIVPPRGPCAAKVGWRGRGGRNPRMRRHRPKPCHRANSSYRHRSHGFYEYRRCCSRATTG